jgi:hypothetical protein
VAKKIWAQLQRTYKEDIRVKIAKRDEQGSPAFVRGGLFEFNPNEEDPCDLERRVIEAYGVGTYRLTFLPPRGSSLQALNYSFTYMDARPEKEKPESLQTSSADGSRNPEAANPSGRLTDLSPATKPAAAGNGDGGEGRGHDPNGPLVGLVTKLLEATMDEQQKRFDRLNSSIEGLTKSLSERHPEPPPTQDMSKMVEAVSGVYKGALELARVQQPASPPPPPGPTGPSEMEKLMAFANILQRMNETKAQLSPPQPPVNINENLVGQVVQVLTAEVDRLRKDTTKTRGSGLESFETIVKVVNLLRDSGLTPENAREVGEIIEGDEGDEAPSPVMLFLQALTPVLGVLANNLGTGLATGIAKGLGELAPGIVGSVLTPKPNTPAASPQPEPQKPVDSKGPAPVPPATPPKNIRPFPTPPWAANSAPPEFRNPVGDAGVAHQPVEAQSATKTATSVPGDRVKRVANLLGHYGQPPVAHPEGAPTQRATLTDAEFEQLLATLRMPMPAGHVAGILLSQIPEGARGFLALPADQAWRMAEAYLTPSQWEAAQPLMPRIKQVFEAMKTLQDSRTRTQEA